MKIVFAVPVFWPATRYGGTVHSLAGLVKALARRGEDVTVITGNGAGVGYLDVPIEEPVPFHGARVLYLQQPRVNRWGILNHIGPVLEREARQADVLHVSSALTYVSCYASRWAMHRRLPYIISTRGSLIRWHKWKDFKKQVAMRLILRPHLRAASWLHATSQLEADELKRFGFPNVAMVPNGIDLPETYPTQVQARQQYGLPLDEPVVVTLGRIHQVKRLELLIRAVAQAHQRGLQPWLLIGGSGQADYVDTLETLATQTGLGQRCQFVGHVTGDAKWTLLRAADVYAQCSEFESFGMAIGEALGMQRPALIGERCSWEDAESLGFVRRGTPATMSQVLEQLLVKRSQLQMIGEKAGAWIRAERSWEYVAAKMVACYRAGDGNPRPQVNPDDQPQRVQAAA